MTGAAMAKLRRIVGTSPDRPIRRSSKVGPIVIATAVNIVAMCRKMKMRTGSGSFEVEGGGAIVAHGRP